MGGLACGLGEGLTISGWAPEQGLWPAFGPGQMSRSLGWLNFSFFTTLDCGILPLARPRDDEMMATKQFKIFREVCEELDALKGRGVRVPKLAYAIADSEANEFYDGGMSVAEISKFCVSLAGVKQ
jgi:hypothetical protein